MAPDWSKPGVGILYFPEAIAYNEGISMADATTMFNKALSDGIITHQGGWKSILNVTGPELTKWRAEYQGPGITRGESVDMQGLYGGGGKGGDGLGMSSSLYNGLGSSSSYGLGGLGGSGSYGGLGGSGLGGSSFNKYGGSGLDGFGGSSYNRFGL